MKDRVLRSDTLQISLAASDQSPKLSVSTTGKFVNWGKNNNYPTDKLLYWFENSALHGSICKGKARYLAGTEIICEAEGEAIYAFLDNANPSEDWHSVRKKCELDKVICGMYFLRVETNALGTPIQFYHLDFAKCRISDCQKFVVYSDDWSKSNIPRIHIPIYTEGYVGTMVYVYKAYAPSGTKLAGTYGKPEYLSAAQDADTDARVSVFFNAIVRNGFSAGTIVTVKNGVKDPKIQAEISEKLKGEHAGEENAGKPVIIFTDKDGNPTEVVSLNPNDLDKQYQEVGKRNQQNIIAGHGVNGILFKIKTEGQLGGRTEIIEAHEQFINEYVKVEQVPFNKMLSMFFEKRTGQSVEFDVEQVQPIGYDWLSTDVSKYLSNDEAREKLGLPAVEKTASDGAKVITDAINSLSPLVANKVLESMSEDEIRALVGLQSKTAPVLDANGNVQQSPSVNDNLTGLSAAENADMLRIVRDFQKGRSGMTEQMAVDRIASYGVSVDKAREYLGLPKIMPVQQSTEPDRLKQFITLFEKYAHDITEDEVVSIENVKFSSALDVLRYENVKLKEFVSEPLKVSVTELRNAILNELKGNPAVKPSILAKKFQVDEKVINDNITVLVEKGFVTSGNDGYTPTEKGINKTTDPIDTEVYTEYVYGLREDQAGTPLILPTTREFCKDLVNLTRSKAISFEKIQALENEFGESAWNFRGGWYNNGTESTPWCRHTWKAVTKIRRKNGTATA